jgi:hypothetical protein
MKKFLLLYMSPVSAEEQMAKPQAEDMEKAMQPWIEWFGEVGEGLLDQGMPLGNSKHVTTSEVSEGASHIMGYSMIQAESMEKALELAQKQPHLTMGEGRSVEVLETLSMPGM